MAKINVSKEIVDNHSTEEVLEMILAGLKTAVRRYDEDPERPDSAGVFFTNVVNGIAYLEALTKKLAPKDPVVA